MSTVFNREYLENAARVKSSAEELRNSRAKARPQSGSAGRGGEFSKTLRELEAEANIAGSKEPKALDKEGIKPVLGSDSARESSRLGVGLKPRAEGEIGPLSSVFMGPAPWENVAASLGNSQQTNWADKDRLCLNTVKNPLSDVNSPTAKSMFKSPSLEQVKSAPTKGALPAPPVILAAREIELKTPALASGKKVLSALRFNTSEQSAPLEKDKVIEQIISTAARYHGIEDELGMAIAKVESGLNPRAVSKDGHSSKGIFQLLDSTAKDMQKVSGMNEPYDPFDPAQNAYLGLAYLKRLNKLFRSENTLNRSTKTVGAKSEADLEKISLAAYNAGEGRIARAQARAKAEGKDPQEFAAIEPYIPASTRQYVKKVLNLKETLLARNQSASVSEMEA